METASVTRQRPDELDFIFSKRGMCINFALVVLSRLLENYGFSELICVFAPALLVIPASGIIGSGSGTERVRETAYMLAPYLNAALAVCVYCDWLSQFMPELYANAISAFAVLATMYFISGGKRWGRELVFWLVIGLVLSAFGGAFFTLLKIIHQRWEW